MTVSKEEFEHASRSRKDLDDLINKETSEYLLEGGLITRYERGGEYTYWGSDDGITLTQIIPAKSDGS